MLDLRWLQRKENRALSLRALAGSFCKFVGVQQCKDGEVLIFGKTLRGYKLFCIRSDVRGEMLSYGLIRKNYTVFLM